jgi:siroheme synthase
MLSAELVGSGLREDTPCLLVSQATRPGQKVNRTTIRDLVRTPAVAAPSLLIVGAAAAEARADEVFVSGGASNHVDEYEEISLDLPQPDEMTAS